MMAGSYDPVERAAEKQRSRDRDEADLASGRIGRADLSRRNGFFSALDMSKSRIVMRQGSEHFE